MRMTANQEAALKRSNKESNFITRETARDALLFLMKDRDYEEIRITDIIRKSGISRSAFYRNYKTKDEVLKDIVGDLNRLGLKDFGKDGIANWRNYIRVIRENRSKLELLIRAHREHFLLDHFNEMADYSTGKDFVTVFPHGFIYNMIIYWAKCGMPGTDDEVLHLIIDACRENARVILSGIIPEKEIRNR